MCRLYAYVGPARPLDQVLFEPPHSLLVQSYAPRCQRYGTINADGWGVGWYDPSVGAEPARYRTATPMWSDAAFAGMAAFVHTGHLIAGVRSATPPTPSEATGAPPFRSGRFLFAHNGLVEGFRDGDGGGTELRRLASPGRLGQVLGAADSEVLFAIVLSRLDEGAGLAEALASMIHDVRALAPARLNLLVSDGEQLLATACGDTLFTRQVGDAVEVASEPTDDGDDWSPVPDGHRVRVAAGQVEIEELP